MDYVVGDIHGTYSALEWAMEAVSFDKTRDRLISVGDLVDRGGESVRVLEFIEEPWFFACLGNHDAQYAFPDGEFYGRDLTCSPRDHWFAELARGQREAITARFSNLPWAIEIETAAGLVGVVHAGVPLGYRCWVDFAQALRVQDEQACMGAIWKRGVARQARRHKVRERFMGRLGRNDTTFTLPDIAYTIHGHTPARELRCAPYHIGNRHYIDTGAGMAGLGTPEEAGLCLFRLDDPQIPVCRQPISELII